jgi:phosphopantothenoylcysteine decarboxylase/phosphopantothenate--cysteine ligase
VKILLGVTGSIAAYKAVELLRELQKVKCDVRVVMSKGASEFITPLTFTSLSGQKTYTSLWEEEPGDNNINHIALADWADCMVIAPCSADTLAKLRVGIADEPLLAVALATKAPLVIAPAMNVNMWHHPAIKENVEILKNRGIIFTAPESGELACGWQGDGRLARSTSILLDIRKALTAQKLQGKKVVVTAGSTIEKIDDVRFLSNFSSGKMGKALAEAAYVAHGEVTLLHGDLVATESFPFKTLKFSSVASLKNVLEKLEFDILIMAAAVSDYSVEMPQVGKIKREASLSLNLKGTPDLLKEISKRKGESSKVIGFALESGSVQSLKASMERKLNNKNLDMILGNLSDESISLETNHVWLLNKEGRWHELTKDTKSEIATQILEQVIALF